MAEDGMCYLPVWIINTIFPLGKQKCHDKQCPFRSQTACPCSSDRKEVHEGAKDANLHKLKMRKALVNVFELEIQGKYKPFSRNPSDTA
jgi:hypothetical protein